MVKVKIDSRIKKSQVQDWRIYMIITFPKIFV